MVRKFTRSFTFSTQGTQKPEAPSEQVQMVGWGRVGDELRVLVGGRLLIWRSGRKWVVMGFEMKNAAAQSSDGVAKFICTLLFL